MVFHRSKVMSAAMGVTIGALIGIFAGVFIGSPVIGLIVGAIIGLRIGVSGKRESHIDMRGGFDPKAFYIIIPVALSLILALWFFRPWLHGAIMLLYTSPSAIIGLLAAAGLMVALWLRIGWLRIPLMTFLILSSVLFIFNHALVQLSIVGDDTYNKIDALPDSTNLRLLPQAIAQRYLMDSLQKSRETVGPMDIIRLDGSLAWTSPRIPDGGILYFTQPVNGLLVVDATTTGRETRIISQEMKVGEGIGITDNVYWNIYKERFFVNVDEVYYIASGDTVYAIASVISYTFRFPVMVPEFAGVYIIDHEGNLQWVEKERLKDIPILQENKVYPEYLARLRVESYKYHLGWWNAVFLHKDQIEISDVWGQGNRQPFLMDTVDGLKWVIATEPYGKSYGVFKIFLVDAFDGRIDMLELDEDLTLTGPVRVVSYVKKQFPEIDWSTAQVIEPRPYTKDGRLLWMLSITPSDFAGISYTVLVDAEDNAIISFQDDAELKAYLSGDIPLGDDKANSTSSSQSAYIDRKTKEIIKEKIEDIEDELKQLKALLEE